MSGFTDRVYSIARTRAAVGDVWGAICAVIYADTILLSHAMADTTDIVVNGKLMSATPVPDGNSAEALVAAMRRIITAALPEDHKERVTSLFPPADFLSELEAPESTRLQAESLRARTEGLKPHAFKARRVSDSRVHARASIKMSQVGVDDVDIHAAIRASDVAVFEWTSVEYALAHADWQLEGHRIRMELAEEMINAIDPGSDKDILRKALREQFEGTNFEAEIGWIIA